MNEFEKYLNEKTLSDTKEININDLIDNKFEIDWFIDKKLSLYESRNDDA